MSYTPNTWATGDTITAVKLNNMEQGIANAGGALFVAEEEGTLDKTWNEIWTAAQSMPVIVTYATETEIDHMYVTAVNNNEPGAYVVMTSDGGYYETNSANGYPVIG